MGDELALAMAARSVKFSNGDGYNLLPGLRAWRNAIADKNPARVMVVGDSVAYGSFASNILSTNWVNRMRTALAAKLGDAGVGWIPIPSGFTPDQAQWTLTGAGWANKNGSNGTNNNGITGRYIRATGTANSAQFTFTGTAFDLVYPGATDGSSSGVAMTVDGVAQTPPNFYRTADGMWGQVQSYSGFAAGSHTVVITASATGSIYLEGAMTYNPPASGPKGVNLYNFSEPSARTTWYTPNINRAVTVASPHLAIIAHGLNDATDQAGANAYMANMGTLITACQNAGASVLLVAYYAVNDARAALWQQLVPQIYQLADQYNCGLVGIYSRWGGSYATAQSAGLMGSGAYDGLGGTDLVHPSDKGHRDIASAMTRHLIGTVA